MLTSRINRSIFNYRSVKTRYANEKDRSLWIDFIKYQMELNIKHGKLEESPFLDKKLYEKELRK